MQLLTQTVKQAIIDAKERTSPQEMCGLIVNSNKAPLFVPVANTHENPNDYFRIDAVAYDMLLKKYEILAVVHSHPKGSTVASQMDIISMNEQDIPFVIVGMDNDIATHYPHDIPLIGRPYVHNKSDCYSIVRDFYRRELNIELSHYPTDPQWWEEEDNEDYYMAHFEEEGFFIVEDGKSNLRYGDLLLCRINNAYSINHAYIYLGDKTQLKSEECTPFIGAPAVLHHGYGEASRRAILGSYRLGQCEVVIRHKEMKDAS